MNFLIVNYKGLKVDIDWNRWSYIVKVIKQQHNYWIWDTQFAYKEILDKNLIAFVCTKNINNEMI